MVKVLFRVIVLASIESGEGSTVAGKEVEMADETMLEGTLVTHLKKAQDAREGAVVYAEPETCNGIKQLS
jgi:hypothetical protein